jgi:hypothetical protein
MQMIILMQLLGDYNGLNRQKACASKPLSIEGFHQPPPFFCLDVSAGYWTFALSSCIVIIPTQH